MNNKKIKNKNGVNEILGIKNMRCCKCGKAVILRNAEGIYQRNTDRQLYVCSGYPECDCYVAVIPGTKTPTGTLADGKLRRLRIEAHRQFDELHKLGYIAREDAYAWLSDLFQIPRKEAHIGQFTEYRCQVLITESENRLKIFEKVGKRRHPVFQGA